MILKDKIQISVEGAQRLTDEILDALEYSSPQEIVLLIYEKRGKYWCPTLKEWRMLDEPQ